MDDCIFCKIAQHKKTAHIVYENKYVIAFLDTDPISDGHTLVIPKKNIRDIHDLDDKIGVSLIAVAKVLADVIEKTFKFDGITITTVSRHFQDVPHLHFHIFGRNKNNDIKIAYPPGISKKKQHLVLIAEIIRKRLNQSNLHL